MSTDTEVRVCGFSALLLREPFDYAPRQRSLWAEQGVHELSRAAMTLRCASPNEGIETGS